MDDIAGSMPAESTKAGADTPGFSNLSGHDLLSQADGRSADKASTTAADKFLPQLELSDFKERATKLVSKISDPADGSYTTADLTKLIEDPGITGKDAVVVATLYETEKDGPEAGGYSPDGSKAKTTFAYGSLGFIAGLKDLPPEQSQTISDLSLLASKAGFDAADSKHDGYLSAADLEKTPAYERLLKEVPQLADSIKPGQAGVNQQEVIAALQGQLAAAGPLQTVNGNYDHLSKRLAAADTRSLYATGKNPLDSIKMDDVRQGMTGDCYFLAALGETAKLRPDIIRDSIKDNADGTYTVTFKGDPAHPIKIAAPTDAELALYSQGGSDGLWAPVMEKAYARYATDVLKRPVADLTRQDAISGGFPAQATELLTGHVVDSADSPGMEQFAAQYSKQVQDSEAKIRHPIDPEEVARALDERRSMTIWTLPDPSIESNGLQAQHVYSVAAYEPGDQGGTIVLRDPSGADIPGQDLHTLSVNQLNQMAVSYDIETMKPLPATLADPPASLPANVEQH